ncbi:MAG: ABC-F family ATP-binding cassette domain-containing protein [Planctomycetes bacterium]|nr:ABC-F family ATP-binding cassette domain-containing protein [Planctomycetota bacterium]
MAIVSLQDVSKAFGPQVVLEAVAFQIEDDDKIGLIGANGTGKSTVMRIVAGELAHDDGTVHRKKDITVGHVHQDPDLSGHDTLHDFVAAAFDDLHDVEREMQSVEADLHEAPPGREHNRLAHRLAELHDLFESRGGYSYASRIDEVLIGLGFPETSFGRPVSKLSGGERTRAAVAQAVLGEPDLLLLDEPTNHLDLDATRWLELFLQRYRKAVVVVSHDRYFLDKIAKKIIEVENSRTQMFKGNYTQYNELKQEQLKAGRREFDKQQAFIAKEEEFIRRNMAGQRTKEAQGRRKRLERVERIEKPQQAEKTIGLEFQPEVRGGNQVLRLRELSKRFGNVTLFEDLTLDLLRGERLGVVGPSGSGKTTLVRVITGEDQPTDGEARLGHNIITGYLAQHRIDLAPGAAIIDEMFDARPKADLSALRSYLGRFLFSGDDIEKRIESLSGGEQTRVALAKLILSNANFLILDEPTNHLDIPSRAVLEQALNSYGGTVLIVSHDRYLLKNVATQILQISSGGARKFPGSYQAYEARMATEEALAKAATKTSRKKTPAAGPQRKRITPSAARKMSMPEIEKNIIRLEAELESITSQLDDPFIYEHPEKAKTIQKSYRKTRTELDRLNAAWEAMVENGEY